MASVSSGKSRSSGLKNRSSGFPRLLWPTPMVSFIHEGFDDLCCISSFLLLLLALPRTSRCSAPPGRLLASLASGRASRADSSLLLPPWPRSQKPLDQKQTTRPKNHWTTSNSRKTTGPWSSGSSGNHWTSRTPVYI